MAYAHTIRAMNEAIYDALRDAMDDGMSTVAELREMAAKSDHLVDRLAGNSATLPRTSAAERIGAA